MGTFLPVGLNLSRKKILIVGGGRTALQKIKMLGQFTNNILVVAPSILPEVGALVKCKLDRYNKKYLPKSGLVYACTNDKVINARIKREANARHLLVNVVDDPALCDFISPAIHKAEEMTVAVSSDGKNVKKSVAWRDKIAEILT
ncbi:MAG: bifunctional precorrin-2 dehydrogenase/sirohydrochlorin ferrochelatase [Candidatus Margulisiibacteriota bacterium]|jgi:precorrin-2 dehydrogenase/sirohydrochlorin ferrochelatase